MTELEDLKQYALQFVGTPYMWGGDDPMAGFDCSGFSIELLQSIGMLPPGYDNSAQGLFYKLSKQGLGSIPGLGSFAFFGRSTEKIIHVGFMLNDRLMLEAGGGGSKTITVGEAIKSNAFIRMRPINWRRDLIAILKPNYEV